VILFLKNTAVQQHGGEVLDRISVPIEMQHTFISKPSGTPTLDSSL